MSDIGGNSGSRRRSSLVRKVSGIETMMEAMQDALFQIQRQIHNSKMAPLKRRQFKTVRILPLSFIS